MFYREHASRTYNSMVYAASVILPELPFGLLTAITYTYGSSRNDQRAARLIWSLRAPMYFISGLRYDAGRYLIFLAVFLLTNLLAVSLCHIIGLLSPNLVIANSLCGTSTCAWLFALVVVLMRDGMMIVDDDDDLISHPLHYVFAAGRLSDHPKRHWRLVDLDALHRCVPS